MKQKLTPTRLDTLLTCHRKHYWRHEVGLQPLQKGEALRFGTNWHNSMEARWRGADYKTALDAALPKGHDLDPEATATMAGLLHGYYEWYGTREIVKTLHPEQKFCMPILGSRSFEAAGKMDGLGVLIDNRLVLLEHKTTGDSLDAGSDYWLRLRYNIQMLQYVLAARALGWNIDTVLYDVVRKPAIRVKQNETAEQFGCRLAQDTQARPEFYFARREVPILDQDLEEFRAQRLELSKLILALRHAEHRVARREQAWPRTVDGVACRFCEFSQFCLQNITVDLASPPAGFKVGSRNPELEENESPTSTPNS